MGGIRSKLVKIDDLIINAMTLLSFGCVVTAEEVGFLCCFFVFQWVSLEFGTGSNYWPLISNPRSKT